MDPDRQSLSFTIVRKDGRKLSLTPKGEELAKAALQGKVPEGAVFTAESTPDGGVRIVATFDVP